MLTDTTMRDAQSRARDLVRKNRVDVVPVEDAWKTVLKQLFEIAQAHFSLAFEQFEREDAVSAYAKRCLDIHVGAIDRVITLFCPGAECEHWMWGQQELEAYLKDYVKKPTLADLEALLDRTRA